MTRDRGGGSRDEGRGACDGQCEASFVSSERSDERSSVAIGFDRWEGGRSWAGERGKRKKIIAEARSVDQHGSIDTSPIIAPAKLKVEKRGRRKRRRKRGG